jgi:hypothetical protein
MSNCSITTSDEGKNWPEGFISAKLTMNPYLLAMAQEAAYKEGLQPWEFINSALWDKLGKPDHGTLMEFAANMEIEDEDPKWKKRLKITARFEVDRAVAMHQMAETVRESGNEPDDGNGNER